MFSFEGKFGNILHTEDCRLTLECLQKRPKKYLGSGERPTKCPSDYVFLDCTFGKSTLRIPNRNSAIRELELRADFPDLLAAELRQRAELLKACCRPYLFSSEGGGFGVVWAVFWFEDWGCCVNWAVVGIGGVEVDGLVSWVDVGSVWVQFSECVLTSQGDALVIYITCDLVEEVLINIFQTFGCKIHVDKWYACKETELIVAERRAIEKTNEPLRHHFGIWRVCYSMHPSKQELEWALQILDPILLNGEEFIDPSCYKFEHS
ncbi:hypothetical protein V2J09_000263 [Rumex salicifolius]